ncbi:hypothetical protein Tco_0252437 [Tanacetum coccineum]
MASNFNNKNDPWEYSLDIDNYDLHLAPVLRSSSSARVKPSPYIPNLVIIIPDPAGIVQLSSSTCVEQSSSTPNPVRIIPGPTGVVQRAKLLRENVFILDSDGGFNVDPRIHAEGTILGIVHHKVIGYSGYGKDITAGAAMILVNVSVFTLKPSEHYLNITKRNVVKIFRKDTKPPMPPISSYPTVEESVEEHDTCDEYLTEGFLTEKEQQKLAQDEEAYREYLEEEAKAEKE